MPSPRGNKSGLLTLAVAAGSLSLAGCLAHDPFAVSADPQSAAAQRVNEAAARDRPFPRWSAFPAAPTNVPAPAEFAVRVADAEAAEAQLNREVAGLTWTLEDTAGFQAATQALVDPEFARPAPADSTAQTEAWAAAARARAVPPPVTK
jgi:hypothetical protein